MLYGKWPVSAYPNRLYDVKFIHIQIQENIVTQLTNIPMYRSYQACPRISFTSMHANPSDPYKHYYLEVRVITYQFDVCLHEYNFKPMKSLMTPYLEAPNYIKIKLVSKSHQIGKIRTPRTFHVLPLAYNIGPTTGATCDHVPLIGQCVGRAQLGTPSERNLLPLIFVGATFGVQRVGE